MPAKHPTSFRISDDSRRMIEALKSRFKFDQSTVIELAIRQLFWREIDPEKNVENTKESS